MNTHFHLILSAVLFGITVIASPSILDGKWSTSCVVGAGGLPTQVTLLIKDGVFQRSARNYMPEDLACESVSLTLSETSGKITINETASIATLIYGKTYITPLFPAVEDQWNQKHECGYSNWISGKRKDVSGRSCSGGVHFVAEDGKISEGYRLEGDRLMFEDREFNRTH